MKKKSLGLEPEKKRHDPLENNSNTSEVKSAQHSHKSLASQEGLKDYKNLTILLTINSPTIEDQLAENGNLAQQKPKPFHLPCDQILLILVK
jgi:hypothetical protein